MLGTHELDRCDFMQVICEGCGIRIVKQDQIRHETIECQNPLAKCPFCFLVHPLCNIGDHIKTCKSRAVFKVEYSDSGTAGNEIL